MIENRALIEKLGGILKALTIENFRQDLRDWGAWARACKGVGFPSRRSDMNTWLITEDRALLIDKTIARVGSYDGCEVLKSVLVYFYKDNFNQTDTAKLLGMSRTRAQSILGQSEYTIYGIIELKEHENI